MWYRKFYSIFMTLFFSNKMDEETNIYDIYKYSKKYIKILEHKRINYFKDVLKLRKHLKKALLKCNQMENQQPADTIRDAIDLITNSVAKIEENIELVDKLENYHIGIHIPSRMQSFSSTITISIMQNENTPSLPLHCFLFIDMISRYQVSSPLITKRHELFSFETAFSIQAKDISIIQDSNISFILYHQVPSLDSNNKSDLLCLAIAPMSFLKNKTKVEYPLFFQTIDNKATNFRLEVILQIDTPFSQTNDIDINRDFQALPEI